MFEELKNIYNLYGRYLLKVHLPWLNIKVYRKDTKKKIAHAFENDDA